MATAREERLAANESMFRAANERMADWDEVRAGAEEELFLCECADEHCRERVPITRAEYEKARADSRHFMVVPGHEIPDIEAVIEMGEGWTKVEKCQETIPVVEALDPRREN